MRVKSKERGASLFLFGQHLSQSLSQWSLGLVRGACFPSESLHSLCPLPRLAILPLELPGWLTPNSSWKTQLRLLPTLPTPSFTPVSVLPLPTLCPPSVLAVSTLCHHHQLACESFEGKDVSYSALHPQHPVLAALGERLLSAWGTEEV